MKSKETFNFLKYLTIWLICNDFGLLDFSMTWFLLKCVQTWCRHTCPTVLEKVSTFAHSDRLCTNESCSKQTYISNLDNIGFWKWYPFFGSQLEIFLYFKYIRSIINIQHYIHINILSNTFHALASWNVQSIRENYCSISLVCNLVFICNVFHHSWSCYG